MALILTSEQQAIVAALRGLKPGAGLMVSADAGAAKTTTMAEAARQMPPRPAVAVTFGRKATAELKAKLPPFFHVKTMNGLGYDAWSRRLGGGGHDRAELTLVKGKVSKLIRAAARELDWELSEEEWLEGTGLLERARQAGLVPEGAQVRAEGLLPDCEESWLLLSQAAELKPKMLRLARLALAESIKMALLGQVDFDDMVYMSVFFGGVYQQWPLVMIDEAQDLNELNHLQVRRVLRTESNLMVVGDQKQGLYLFRGAHSDGMNAMRGLRSSWIDLPLHVTFRCPEVVVARQQGHAPGYAARAGAPEGEVVDLRGAPWRWNLIRAKRGVGDRIFVLCRNNAPLVRLGLRLASERIFAEYLGEGLGVRLIALVKQVLAVRGSKLPMLSTKEFNQRLVLWANAERAKAGGRKSALAWIEERVECLVALVELSGARTVEELVGRIRALFEQAKRSTDAPTLTTIHGAKGLEAEVVLHLDPWRIPSAFAQGEAELGQEANARYVAETRTKRVLIEADMAGYEGVRSDGY